MNKKLIKISLVSAALSLTAFAAPLTMAASPSCDSTITSNTTLDSNMACAGSGITIGSNNVVLDCAGYSITGNGPYSSSNGVYLLGVSGATVKNCTISGYNYGIHAYYADSNTLTGNTLSSNSNGIYMREGRGNTLSNNTLTSNSTGIHLFNTGNNSVTQNNIATFNQQVGMVFYGTFGNTVRANTITGNNNIYSSGMAFQNSYSNTITNNSFNNLFKNTQFWSVRANTWSAAVTAGTNIIGGSLMGGNFWSNAAGTGFSQTCTDADRNGICDSSLALATGNTDLAPLAATPTDPNPPTTGASVSDADGDGILDSATVTLAATDDDSGVASVSVSLNGAAAVVTNGSSATVTLATGANSLQYFAVDNAGNNEAVQVRNYTYPDNCPSSANPDQLDTDADGMGNVCDSNDDNDAMEDVIDSDPLVVSSNFSDGTTFGAITATGGWTLSVTDLAAPAGVRVSVVSGAGTIAKFLTCNNNVETQLNAIGETADITCGSTTVTAVNTNADIRIREPQGGSGGKATLIKLLAGQTVKMGSYVAASPSNTSPLTVEVVDANDTVLGTGSLQPGQTLNIEPNGPNDTVLITNQSSEPVVFTLDGAALTLIPGEQFFDRCPNSSMDAEPIENRFSWIGGGSFTTKDPKTKSLLASGYTLNQTKGCTCNQILEKTSGKEKGQLKGGCTKEAVESFITQSNLLALLYQFAGSLYYVIAGAVAALSALGWYLVKHSKKS